MTRQTPDPAVAKNTPDNLARPEHFDIELFAGGGGLAVGLKQAGFSPSQLFELDPACCNTLTSNTTSAKPTLAGKIHKTSAQKIDWSPFKGRVRLLAGGAPCQPFSLAGKHEAHNDGRNLFPEVVRAIRELQPKAVIIENVRGMMRDSFRPYFEYVIRQIETPDETRRSGEKWMSHDKRLWALRKVPGFEPTYHAIFKVVDAADYGVPQNRWRIVIVATRRGLPQYTFPKPTHSEAALISALAGREYWERHGVKKPANGVLTHKLPENDGTLPWVTVRDAITSLPAPATLQAEAEMNHWTIPGARAYHGHNGSSLDRPSKTIKAGVHGVPGGENTVRDTNGVFRYFTLRETARIQTFPDHHLFVGTRTQITRQIGNAVPSALATAIAKPLHDLLATAVSGVNGQHPK